MKASYKYIYCCLLAGLLTCCQVAFAGDVDKAFKYLNAGDYINAKKYLSEVLRDEPQSIAGNFGMAKFYFVKDNALYDVDSANKYIVRAAIKLPLNPEDKQTKKLLTLGVRDYTINTLLQQINQEGYAIAEKQNTIESFQHFLDAFTEKGYVDKATMMRNRLAYAKYKALGTSAAMVEFMKMYPAAQEVNEAKLLYEKWLYEEITADHNFSSYQKYIEQNPNGLYIKEAKKGYEDQLLQYYNIQHNLPAYLEFARKYKDHPAYGSIEDSIYVLATEHGTIDEFRNFALNYTDNRNNKEAWEQFYTLFTASATAEVYNTFNTNYPNFFDKERVAKDMELATLDLKPMKNGDKFGFVQQVGPDSVTFIIYPQYDEAFNFRDGYAAVRSKPCIGNRCNYYYINRANKIVLQGPYNFAGDFENGLAIAGVGDCEVDSCRYGLIDKRGFWVVPAIYEEFEEPSNGLYLVAKNDKYGFINAKGEIVIALKYTGAVSFSEGIAAVALDNNWFFVDTTGRQLFLDFFHDVSSYKGGYCAASKDGEQWGYIDLTGNFVIKPQYDEAEDFDGDFAIVSKKERDPKHRDLYILQRYKIDRNGKVIEKLTAPKESTKKVQKKRGR